MMTPMRRQDREIKDQAAIAEILGAGRGVTIAMVDDGEPYLVTMNYGTEERDGKIRLWLHSASEGRKIECVRRNPRVCFSVVVTGDLMTGERACDCSMRYQSVVGWGSVNIVTDELEKRNGLDRVMLHYTGKCDLPYTSGLLERTMVLCLDVESVTAKKRQ